MRIVNYGSFQCLDFKCLRAPKSYPSLLLALISVRGCKKAIQNFVLMHEDQNKFTYIHIVFFNGWKYHLSAPFVLLTGNCYVRISIDN
jgi:hypothetical protein